MDEVSEPKPNNRPGLKPGAIVGAFRRPDGTLDTSRALVKLDTSTNQKSHDDKGKEELRKAQELAEQTRALGVGQLYGFLYPIDKTISVGYYPGMGFDKGKTIEGDPDQYRKLQQRISYKVPPREVWHDFNTPERQVWMIDKMGDLQRITYIMYTEAPREPRPGASVLLSVLVSEDLAEQLNTSVMDNPDFADLYFKSLFPGIVGSDGNTNIRRKRATELLVLDRRQNPASTQGIALKFTTPIEF